MNLNSFANSNVRFFGTTLINGCETKSHAFCRVFLLNRYIVPKYPLASDVEFADLCNRLGVGY